MTEKLIQASFGETPKRPQWAALLPILSFCLAFATVSILWTLPAKAQGNRFSSPGAFTLQTVVPATPFHQLFNFCKKVHSVKAPSAETPLRKKIVSESFTAWKDRPDYDPRKVEKLEEFELSLPAERVTYLRFQHEEGFATVRIFNGSFYQKPQKVIENGKEVYDVAHDSLFPMERKFEEMPFLERKGPSFELGLLTSAGPITDGGDAMVFQVAQHLDAIVFNSEFARTGKFQIEQAPHEIFGMLARANHRQTLENSGVVYATARAAQARLYRRYGFTDTGFKTPDGMLLLSSPLLEFIRTNSALRPEPRVAKESDFWAKENEGVSQSVRNNYLQIFGVLKANVDESSPSRIQSALASLKDLAHDAYFIPFKFYENDSNPQKIADLKSAVDLLSKDHPELIKNLNLEHLLNIALELRRQAVPNRQQREEKVRKILQR